MGDEAIEKITTEEESNFIVYLGTKIILNNH